MKNGYALPTFNYIRLINWTWEVMPFIDGCKTYHVVLFLAIVDSINRNKWAKTSIPYDYLINKCKISKQVYLDARKWLINHNLLEVQTGKNGYQMAIFDIGSEVRNQTAIITAIDTATITGTNGSEVRNQTAAVTHSKTVTINKPKPDKPEPKREKSNFPQWNYSLKDITKR